VTFFPHRLVALRDISAIRRVRIADGDEHDVDPIWVGIRTKTLTSVVFSPHQPIEDDVITEGNDRLSDMTTRTYTTTNRYSVWR
jgi:hypothetical protein